MTIIRVVNIAYGHAISNISRTFISPLFANSRLEPEICFCLRRCFDTSIASPVVAKHSSFKFESSFVISACLALVGARTVLRRTSSPHLVPPERYFPESGRFVHAAQKKPPAHPCLIIWPHHHHYRCHTLNFRNHGFLAQYVTAVFRAVPYPEYAS